MLKEKTEREVQAALPQDVLSVTAVPVYGTQRKYETASDELRVHLQERLTFEILLPRIPVPRDTVSFDDILHLRERPAFQASLKALRTWQRNTLRELFEERNDTAVKRAARDFAEMVRKYKEVLEEVQYTKVQTAICLVFAFGAAFTAATGPVVGAMAAVSSPVFSIRNLIRPCWKDLQETQCFPAGVVYEASKLA